MAQHVISAPSTQSIIVRAGPGAGKTYLIAQRIAYLLKSDLRKNAHIACITYTNTGIDEVTEELIPSHFIALPNNLYVGTIHSYLIEHIIRPYGHFLPEVSSEFRLLPPNGFVNKFPLHDFQNLPEYKKKAFENIGYDARGTYVCYRSIRSGRDQWEPSQTQMRSFKRKMHSEGYLDLHDVLWFSLKLLRTFPHIAECLACRFESILVDEFQDTTDVQAEILAVLQATGKCSLFLVGDPDQSIFSFSGARPVIFERLCQDDRFLCAQCGEIEHLISQNRRSSQRIIDFLNGRSTMISGQIPVDQEWVDYHIPVTVLIGGIEGNEDTSGFRGRVVQRFFQLMEQNDLDRDQIDSFGIYAFENRNVATLGSVASDPDFQTISVPSSLNQIRNTNGRLYRTTYALCTALKHRQAGEWSDANSAVNDELTYHFYGANPAFCDYADPVVGLDRQLWNVVMWMIMQQLPENELITVRSWLYEVKAIIADVIQTVGGNNVRQRLGLLDCRGSVRSHAEACSIAEVLSSIIRPGLHDGNYRTIHGAKGTQREAVLVYASSLQELEQWLFCADIGQNEQSRIGYVGFSRAKKILCISCDTITNDQHSQLQRLPVEIEILEPV